MSAEHRWYRLGCDEVGNGAADELITRAGEHQPRTASVDEHNAPRPCTHKCRPGCPLPAGGTARARGPVGFAVVGSRHLLRHTW